MLNNNMKAYESAELSDKGKYIAKAECFITVTVITCYCNG